MGLGCIPFAAMALAMEHKLGVSRVGALLDGAFLVPTYQRVGPIPSSTCLPGRPVDMSVSPDGTLLAVKVSNGLVFVELPALKVVQVLPLPKLNVDFPLHLGGNAPAGLLWSQDGSEVWETDAFTALHGARRTADGRFEWSDVVNLPFPRSAIIERTDKNAGNTLGPAPIGIFSGGGSHAWVALSRSNALADVDLARHRVAGEISVGVAPYGISGARAKLYVTNWGGATPRPGAPFADSSGSRVSIDPKTGVANSGSVSVIDAQADREIRQLRVGLHPSAIVSSRDGRNVYVANANSDSVSVIDTSRDVVTRTLHLQPAEAPGLAPDALAVGPDNAVLYVAEGGANQVVVVDLRSGRTRLVTDTGWYPSAVISTGRSLYVASLKGIGSRARDAGFAFTYMPDRRGGYNVYDYVGVVQAVSSASSQPARPESAPNVAGAAFLHRTFHHVVYIIKENHTYDDIYGDLPQGNGDKTLCLFCGRATPNQHALARRFGIFDNFYVNGTLSADGHNWTDEANATDYLERSLSGWARSYPSAGGDPLAYSSEGFIWNRVISAGLSFRDYGEFIPDLRAFFAEGRARRVSWSETYSDYVHHTHRISWRQEVDIAPLRPYVDTAYPSYSLRISDQYRASVFIKDFEGLAARNAVPSLMLVALPNDHTAYATPGFPTPVAFAADNDLALGRIVAAISHSRFWRDTAIFVVEDDAQDGVDHVDGHRTAALVISAHNRPALVDGHFYNQTSILHTIELIFGLAPLTRFDKDAPEIVYPFQAQPDLRPYQAVQNAVPLDTLNPSAAALRGLDRRAALASATFPIEREDAVDPELSRAALQRAAHFTHSKESL